MRDLDTNCPPKSWVLPAGVTRLSDLEYTDHVPGTQVSVSLCAHDEMPQPSNASETEAEQ